MFNAALATSQPSVRYLPAGFSNQGTSCLVIYLYLHTHSRTRKQYAPGLFVAIQKFHLAGAHKKKKDKEIRTRTNSPARIDWLSCLHYSLLGAMLHCPSTSQVPPSPISPVAGTLRRCNQLHGVPPALSIGPRQSRLHRCHLPFFAQPILSHCSPVASINLLHLFRLLFRA